MSCYSCCKPDDVTKEEGLDRRVTLVANLMTSHERGRTGSSCYSCCKPDDVTKEEGLDRRVTLVANLMTSHERGRTGL